MYLGVSRHYRIIGSCFTCLNKCLSMPMCLDVESIKFFFFFYLEAFCQNQDSDKIRPLALALLGDSD